MRSHIAQNRKHPSNLFIILHSRPFVAAVLAYSSLSPHGVGTKLSGLGVTLPTKGAVDTQPCVFVAWSWQATDVRSDSARVL